MSLEGTPVSSSAPNAGTASRRPHASSSTATRHGHGSDAGRPSRGRPNRPSQPGRGSSGRGSSGRAAVRSPFDGLAITELSPADLVGFAELGLPASVVTALTRQGITKPFPVQAATIPSALAGRDILGRAATGAGKTLAFGLPMIVRLMGGVDRPRRPRGLVLVPTRELAMQVVDSLAPLAQAADLSLRLVAGGLPIGKQISAMVRGVDIVVATPGRLVDLIERRACDLSEVEVTTLDEADHMADLGFLPVVRQLLDQTPAGGQRLLFSATLDGDVATLVTDYLHDPVIRALAPPRAAVTTMDHHVFRVPRSDKWALISQIAARDERTILFVRTKHGADRLARNLNAAGVAAGAIHGGLTQPQRTRALNQFKDGSVSTLVATDVAARGIHVDDVSLVVHVDPPADEKDYLHRSGRTARAGENGLVVTIVTPDEESAVTRLMSAAGVSPIRRAARSGDPETLRITGGREPSGVPVAVAPAPAPRTSGRPYGHPRSSGRDRGPANGRSPRPAARRGRDGM